MLSVNLHTACLFLALALPFCIAGSNVEYGVEESITNGDVVVGGRPGVVGPAGIAEPRPSYNVSRERKQINNRYIMKLRDDCTESQVEDVMRVFHNSYYHKVETLNHTSGLAVIKGVLTRRMLRRLRAKTGVEYCVNDEQCGISCIDKEVPDDAWGLDSLDARENNRLQFNVRPGSQQTVVYVLDTGIRTTHSEFRTRRGSRASRLFSTWNEAWMHPHGTACAAIIGGNKYGVNTNVVLKDVHVMNNFGLGFTSDIITGIDRAIADHKERGPGARSVISMSIGQSTFEPLDTAVRNAISAGMVVVTAAGNYGVSADFISPCRVTDTICVGAIDKDNEFMSWSNYGPSIDISAPGANVRSAATEGDESYLSYYGTSFACPHVTGVVSAFLGQASRREATQAGAKAYIRRHAAPNAKFSRSSWAETVRTPSLCLNVPTCRANSGFGRFSTAQ